MRLFSQRCSLSTPSCLLAFYSCCLQCCLLLKVVLAADEKKCSYGEPLKHSSGVDLCCGRCDISFIRCPETYQCVLDHLERWHPVCCKDQYPVFAVALCNRGQGELYLNGEFKDRLQPDNAIIYPLHATFHLQRVNIKCCFLGSDTEPRGLIFSSPDLYSDSNWLCLPSSKDSKQYPIVSFSNNSSPSAYAIERNFGEDFSGYLFQYDPRFDAGANWIWSKRLDSSNYPQCVACMYSESVSDIQRDLVDSYSTKRILSRHSRIYLYGFYREFHFTFELRTGNCNLYPTARVIFMPCHKSEDETFLTLEFGVHDSRSLQMQICSRRKYLREVICETVAYSSHKQNTDLLPCETFAQFSLSIFKNGSIELRSDKQVRSAGVLLLLWRGPWQESCTTITHFNVTSSSGSATEQPHIRYYRSTEVNRCLFVERELEGLTPCGNGYIMEEEQCLKCGCCFFPSDLIRSVHKIPPACYTPLAFKNKIAHDRVLPANCLKPFAEVIGDIQLHVKPFPVAKLDECVTFIIALENTVNHIQIKLSFGDGTFINNVTVRLGVDVPAWVLSPIKSSYFIGTVTHFFQTSFEKIVQLEIFGRNSDKVTLIKSMWVTPLGQMARLNLIILASDKTGKPCAEQEYAFALIQSVDNSNFSISVALGDEIIQHEMLTQLTPISEVPAWLAPNVDSRDSVRILYRRFPGECQDYSIVLQMIHKASQTDLNTAKLLALYISQYDTRKTAVGEGITISPSSSTYTTSDLVVLTATAVNSNDLKEDKRQVLWHCTMNASWSWPEVLLLEMGVTSNKEEECFEKGDPFTFETEYLSPFSAMFFLHAERFFATTPSRTYHFHILVRTTDGKFQTGYYPLTLALIVPVKVSITCIANCENMLKVDEVLMLSYNCVSCLKQETLQIHWTLYPERPNSTVASITWPAKLSSAAGDVLVIHGRLFLMVAEDENYIIRLVAKRMDNSSASQIYKFTVKNTVGRREPLKVAHLKNQEKILIYQTDYWLYLAIPLALLLGLIAALLIIYIKKCSAIDQEVPKPEEPPDAPSGPPPASASLPGLEQHLTVVSLHTPTGEPLSVPRRSIAPLDLNQRQS